MIAYATSDRGFSSREPLPLPTRRPCTVHLGTMSFDATEGDIQAFFADCQVTYVRSVVYILDSKPKVFCFAEFETLEGLKKALDFNGTQFQGRNIRVSVAEPRTYPAEQDLSSSTYQVIEKERQETRELIDWTRKGPLPDIAPKRGAERGPFTSKISEHGQETGADRPSRRPPFDQGDGRQRDFSNWERKGPLTPTIPPNTLASRNTDRPPSHEGPRDRRNSPAWGEGRSQDGSRPPRRDFSDRPAPERTPTAAEMDNQWRLKMRPDPLAPTSPANSGKEFQAPQSPAITPAVPASAQTPATRPRLNLQKRTVSQAEASPALPTGNSDAKASPFGAARPIDTSARDKEIEEKLKVRKQQEEKLRDEKRIADEKAKEEKRSLEKSDKTKAKVNGQSRDSDVHETAGKNYQILRRDAGEAGEDESDVGDINAITEGAYTDESKDVKPQTIITEANGPSSDNTTAEQLQEEGWSTVSKPSKGRRGGNNSARAIAS